MKNCVTSWDSNFLQSLLHSGDELFLAEWLVQKYFYSSVSDERVYARTSWGTGDGYDPSIGTYSADLGTCVRTVHTRHNEIHQYHIEALSLIEKHCLLS